MRDVVVDWNGEKVCIGAVDVEGFGDPLNAAVAELPGALARFGPIERAEDGKISKMSWPARLFTVVRALSDTARGSRDRDRAFEDAIVSQALREYGPEELHSL